MAASAASSASESFEASLPPACATLGLPPPPPPHSLAATPTTAPALAPAATAPLPKFAAKATLPPAALASTTAPPSPSAPHSASAALASDFASAPSISATTYEVPSVPPAVALAARDADLASARSARRAAISFAALDASFCMADTRSPISAGATLSAALTSLTTASRSRRSSTTPAPDTASMRRTPLATPASDTILKPPISAVVATCVPPHSSMDTPGTSTTRTVSPYFSPNMATAPAAFASSMGISLLTSGVPSAIHSLMRSSTAATSLALSPRGQLKSKRRRSSVTSEPAWLISSPTTCLSAACSRCVDVWLARTLRRKGASTAALTLSPTRSTPRSRRPSCMNVPVPALRQPTTSTRAPPSLPSSTRSTPLSPTCPPPSA
mmetsp:Transcript_9009/g.36794  ORF Transcript_9009/g.36794 Transcript_9009/m.36794 type:complete len:383 (-) Transcript_9009:1646-2794(-)